VPDSEPSGVDAACAGGVEGGDERRALGCESPTTNALRPPTPSRSPRVAKALATSSETAVNGFGNLVTVFLLLMVHTQACREGHGVGSTAFSDVARCT